MLKWHIDATATAHFKGVIVKVVWPLRNSSPNAASSSGLVARNAAAARSVVVCCSSATGGGSRRRGLGQQTRRREMPSRGRATSTTSTTNNFVLELCAAWRLFGRPGSMEVTSAPSGAPSFDRPASIAVKSDSCGQCCRSDVSAVPQLSSRCGVLANGCPLTAPAAPLTRCGASGRSGGGAASAAGVEPPPSLSCAERSCRNTSASSSPSASISAALRTSHRPSTSRRHTDGSISGWRASDGTTSADAK
mmetsp:Transcript_28343/g.94084  ORF Transcript_28343/g.94084 Transcript_28343/m.94084 type:complete len:249 (+) Transcript_28343:1510-2256(+)